MAAACIATRRVVVSFPGAGKLFAGWPHGVTLGDLRTQLEADFAESFGSYVEIQAFFALGLFP